MWKLFIVPALLLLITAILYYGMPVYWKISEWLSSSIKKDTLISLKKKLKATIRVLKYSILVTIGLLLFISFLNDSYIKQLEISGSILFLALILCLFAMFNYKEKYIDSIAFADKLKENINGKEKTISELYETIFAMQKTIKEQQKLINKS
jgi:hypothetical protein